MTMKTPQKIISLLAGSALFAASFMNAATTDVVGYTTTTLPAGAGNLFAPAFVNNNSFMGVLTGAAAGPDSTLTLSGTMTAAAFNESSDVAGVSKGYPLYYLEVLNDTNASDSIDTEGLIIDIVSNSTSGVVVAADTSTLGIQGDEQIAIRKHLTLGDVFSGSTGLTSFTDAITIYNEDGPGTAVTHVPDGAGGFLLNSDFVTGSTDAPIYPGTGLAIANVALLTIVPTGVVKESDTQVAIYGNSVVNIISVLKPISNVVLSSDGRLNEAMEDFTDVVTQYSSDGSLLPVVPSGASQPGFVDDGSGGFLSSDFSTPVSVTVDGSSEAFAVGSTGDRVYKISGTVITQN